MSTMTISGGYARAYNPQIHGLPGLAVRLGRRLELWGRRAARPMTSSRAQLLRAAELRELTASAERQATVERAWIRNIR